MLFDHDTVKVLASRCKNNMIKEFYVMKKKKLNEVYN